MSMRNPNIALLVIIVIIFGGGLPLSLAHAGGAAIQAVGVVGIAAGFIVLHVLDDREFRPKRKD